MTVYFKIKIRHWNF